MSVHYTLMAAMISVQLVREGTSIQLSNAPWIAVNSKTSLLNSVVPMMRSLLWNFLCLREEKEREEEEKAEVWEKRSK